MDNHTKGPWHIDRATIGGALEIVSRLRRIAKALYHMGSEDPEVDANARLIAAAPDMLAGLRRAEQTIRNLGNGLTGDEQTIAMNEAANLRADIAKATKTD